jgi:hypothetical protein
MRAWIVSGALEGVDGLDADHVRMTWASGTAPSASSSSSSSSSSWTAMDRGDRAADFRFLVRDRARQFTASSDTVASAGIQAVKIRPEALRCTASHTTWRTSSRRVRLRGPA